MNFDFAITAILITCCNEKGQSTKNNKGNMKNWNEIVDAFKPFYANTPMIIDLEALHILRNSIQHGDTIPSTLDIEHQIEREFFDCLRFNPSQNQEIQWIK
jgi:hypothetical protein